MAPNPVLLCNQNKKTMSNAVKVRHCSNILKRYDKCIFRKKKLLSNHTRCIETLHKTFINIPNRNGLWYVYYSMDYSDFYTNPKPTPAISYIKDRLLFATGAV
jgi:hypothetical protein